VPTPHIHVIIEFDMVVEPAAIDGWIQIERTADWGNGAQNASSGTSG
jgi:hypothetical protein